MAAGSETAPFEHLLRLGTQDRDAQHALGVGRRGEQAEEPALADHFAVLVEDLDPDVVEIGVAVHRGARVRLGQHQDTLFPGPGLDPRRELGERAGKLLVGAQDAQPGSGHRPEHVLTVDGIEHVLAIAEEGEMVVGQPPQQLLRLGHLFGRHRQLVLLQLGGDLLAALAHTPPILDGLPDVSERVAKLVGDLFLVGGVRLTVGLDVHPGLDESVRQVADGGVGLPTSQTSSSSPAMSRRTTNCG